MNQPVALKRSKLHANSEKNCDTKSEGKSYELISIVSNIDF